MKKLKQLFGRSFVSWKEDAPFTEAAALSFYAFLALPALFFILMGMANIFLDAESTREYIFRYSTQLFGGKNQKLISDLFEQTTVLTGSSWKTFLATILLFVTGSKIFGQLQASLNKIWKISFKGNIRKRLVNQIFLFCLVFGLGIFFLVSIFIESILVFFEASPVIGILFGFLVLWFGITLIYKFLPAGKVSWKDIFVGAFFTSILLTLGKLFTGFFLSQSLAGTLSGTIGVIITLLLGLYYSSLIFLFGATLTQNYANIYGKKIK